MRAIGRLENESEARLFSRFLYARQIANEVEVSQEGDWIVWVHSEDMLEETRELLDRFKEDPGDPKYMEAAREALRKQKDDEKKTRQSRTRYVDVRTTWTRSQLPGLLPVTAALLTASVVVTLLTDFGKHGEFKQYLIITRIYEGPNGTGFYIMRGLPEIRNGQVWRLFTPMFLHFNALHLLFNMLWLYSLGRMVEHKQGALRLALIVMGIGALSNFGQYVTTGSPNFGGMSGVVYGLLGYIWLRGKLDPSSGLALDRRVMVMMMIWFLVCFAMPEIANAAHAVGLGLGLAWGYLSSGHWKKRLRGRNR